MKDNHQGEIIDAFAQIAKEKNIEKDQLNLIIEEIFKMMIKKKYGTSDNFDVIVNLEKAAIEIYQTKTVVENVEDPITQIDIDDARKVEPSMEVGDDFIDVVDPGSFGRRLIINARQTLNQKLRDIERKIIYDEFSQRTGEVVLGEIRQINRHELIISFERTELIMPRAEQIPNERYKRGDSIRAIIKEVTDDPRGPRIIVSRAEPLFLIRLFENEVPEIYDGIIEIKAIARDPGERTKIAVYSNDKRIDAVGACVGMKGIRIQAIVKELNNEKIDIVSWSNDSEILISRALSPAKPLRVEVDSTERRALAVINDEEMSVAVGRHGQNINLASRLTGYDIQTIKYSELTGAKEKEADAETEETIETKDTETGSEPPVEPAMDVAETEESSDDAVADESDDDITSDTAIGDIKGVSKAAAAKFAEAGYTILSDIPNIDALRAVDGVTERSLNKLISTYNKLHVQD